MACHRKDPRCKDIRIRKAKAADRPQLIQLVNAAFSVETFFEGARTDEERLAAAMAKGSILVAEDRAGRPLASIYMENRGKRGYLGMLAVDPAHRREGLGRRMMAEAEARLHKQGCQAAEILVLSLRPELPPIYRRLGYAIAGTEPLKSTRPLKPGTVCHCIRMAKRLHPVE